MAKKPNRGCWATIGGATRAFATLRLCTGFGSGFFGSDGLSSANDCSARDLAETLMRIEQVPDIPMFRQNTAAFVHELPDRAISNVEGKSNYVRVQVLTNAGALDRDKQRAVVRQFTDLIAAAAGDPSLTTRTWVLLTEAVDDPQVSPASYVGMLAVLARTLQNWGGFR